MGGETPPLYYDKSIAFFYVRFESQELLVARTCREAKA